jgi:hypothetical protein
MDAKEREEAKKYEDKSNKAREAKERFHQRKKEKLENKIT